jgi:hypothetical protein
MRCEQCRQKRWQVSRRHQELAGCDERERSVPTRLLRGRGCSWRVCNSASPASQPALCLLCISMCTLKNTHLLPLCLIWFFAPSLALTRKLFSPVHLIKIKCTKSCTSRDALCIILQLRLSRRGRELLADHPRSGAGVASTRRHSEYFNQRWKWIN